MSDTAPCRTCRRSRPLSELIAGECEEGCAPAAEVSIDRLEWEEDAAALAALARHQQQVIHLYRQLRAVTSERGYDAYAALRISEALDALEELVPEFREVVCEWHEEEQA